MVTNEDNARLLKCFCVLKSIKLNNHLDNELMQQITQHTHRISWSGGSDNNPGIKYIDSVAELNLVSLRGLGALVFETAKGQRGENLVTGIYDVDLILRGKMGDSDFREKPFSIRFEYVFEGEQTSMPFRDHILSGKLGNYEIRLLGKK